MIISGLLAANAVGTAIAVAFGAGAGAVAGYLIGDTAETIAGIVGGLWARSLRPSSCSGRCGAARRGSASAHTSAQSGYCPDGRP